MKKGNEMEGKGKKPFYKRLWFIAIVIVIVVGLLANHGSDNAADAGTESAAAVSGQTETAFLINL